MKSSVMKETDAMAKAIDSARHCKLAARPEQDAPTGDRPVTCRSQVVVHQQFKLILLIVFGGCVNQGS